jgi:hypothetical protein
MVMDTDPRRSADREGRGRPGPAMRATNAPLGGCFTRDVATATYASCLLNDIQKKLCRSRLNRRPRRLDDAAFTGP